MTSIQILSEKPLAMFEVKDVLESKKKKNIGARAARTLEYIDSTMQSKKSKELLEKLTNLNIGRLKEKHLRKVVDLMPKDLDSLRIIFTGENVTLKQEDLEKILEVIKNG